MLSICTLQQTPYQWLQPTVHHGWHSSTPTAAQTPAQVDVSAGCVPWVATKICKRKYSCSASMFLRLMHCLSIASSGGGLSSQKVSLLMSNTLCKAWRTTGMGAARALLAGGLATSLEALGDGQGRYEGAALHATSTAHSLHLH